MLCERKVIAEKIKTNVPQQKSSKYLFSLK